jgi:hypothetical protein
LKTYIHLFGATFENFPSYCGCDSKERAKLKLKDAETELFMNKEGTKKFT